ncbi:hypothetical protein HYH02_014965 [Chlamydomonas schloesseri]|uniref:SAC3/GANP/THP3 conserved domain-containing protein n=1 Tax=Chlamydomonas schloesseri TaxID=2026947 RepID=A0A835SP68_9CHLO|nr:hypothetical protein HYH02_014965 [Chlamydomonas schloesseri]|eukprot:KAG2425749.1 hypothetical protein HYH02_014965 [Chlamydomonas schloesseri]
MGSRRPPAASSSDSSSSSSPSSSSDDESTKRKRKLKTAAKAAKKRRSADTSPAVRPSEAAAGTRPANNAGACAGADGAVTTGARGVATGSACTSTSAGAGAGGATQASPTAADKRAAKRAKADALMAKLTAKLEATSNPAKRLALQDKMLQLLPKCTPQQQPQPPQPAAKPKAAAAAAGLAGGSRDAGGFQFKLARTPKAAIAPAAVAAALQGPEELARRRQRAQRFAGGGTVEDEEDEADAVLTAAGGVGRSQALEKEYLRLTALPRAADVRPPHVLAAALKLVKAKWLAAPDYHSASEQLKAIRQDLTVQHVRDSLTVDVYETAGRLALEADDLAEFRRCHAVLRQLYAELGGANAPEFEAYGLLYTQATAAARNTLSLELSRVPHHLLPHPFVRHAMDVCAAARSGNYARFLELYEGAPRMSPYLMDRLLGRMRLLALSSSVAAFRPLPLPLCYLAEQMGLEGEAEAADLAEQYGAVVDRAAGVLDTRTSSARPLGPPRPPGSEGGAAG